MANDKYMALLQGDEFLRRLLSFKPKERRQSRKSTRLSQKVVLKSSTNCVSSQQNPPDMHAYIQKFFCCCSALDINTEAYTQEALEFPAEGLRAL